MTLLAIDGVLTETEPRVAWAVGPEGGFNWMALWATDEAAAVDLWLSIDTAGITERDQVDAVRVEAWDTLTGGPGTADWIAAGFATKCARCTENVDADNLGTIVDDETVLCSACVGEPA